MTSQEIKRLQKRLKALRHYSGSVDGIAGPQTTAAVLAFQAAAGLLQDGIAGPMTLGALFGYSIMEAARLAALSYSLSPRNDGAALLGTARIVDCCPAAGVEAYLLDSGVLLIPGSNSLADYLRFNLRPFRIGSRTYNLSTTATVVGASRTIWHQGFFAHAKVIYDWIGTDKNRWPDLIVGHSLGAASAQILSKSWARAAIGFAAPRPRKSSGAIALDKLSLSICRTDDIVCGLPSGFHRMGDTRLLSHAAPKPGLNHNMAAYIDALNHRKAGVNIPDTWAPPLGA